MDEAATFRPSAVCFDCLNFCLLRQLSLSECKSVNAGAAGNFSTVFFSLPFPLPALKERKYMPAFWVAACQSRVLTSGFVVKGAGGLINSCEGRMHCSIRLASLVLRLDFFFFFFFPLEVAVMHIFHTQQQQQQSLAAFCMH